MIQLINGQKMNQPAHIDNPPAQKPLSVGFILAPEFTLSAFSNFDVLRLAADEGDFSRQIRCKWKILSHDSRPILSSSGLEVIPTAGLEDPQLSTTSWWWAVCCMPARKFLRKLPPI
jgi:transcriptional regulator GlxA family with amidase domain